MALIISENLKKRCLLCGKMLEGNSKYCTPEHRVIDGQRYVDETYIEYVNRKATWLLKKSNKKQYARRSL